MTPYAWIGSAGGCVVPSVGNPETGIVEATSAPAGLQVNGSKLFLSLSPMTRLSAPQN